MLDFSEVMLVAHVLRGTSLPEPDGRPSSLMLRMRCDEAVMDTGTGRTYSCGLEHEVRDFFVYEVTFGDDEEVREDIADEELADCNGVNAAALLGKLRIMSPAGRRDLICAICNYHKHNDEKQLVRDMQHNLDSQWTV